MRFVVDTREQNPYRMKGAIKKALTTGDYSVEGLEDYVAVERKGLGDLFNCLSGDGLKRFTGQLKRLGKFRIKALIVEASWTSLAWGHVYSKIPGEVAQERVMRLTALYGVPVLFVASRTEGKEILTHILCNAYEMLQREGLLTGI